MPPNALSISSIQRMHGLTASASWMHRLMFFSDSPTVEPKRRPTSSLKRGRFHIPANALQHRLLPEPGTPMSRSPFGTSSPRVAILSALRRKTCSLSTNHFFISLRPPMCSIISLCG